MHSYENPTPCNSRFWNYRLLFWGNFFLIENMLIIFRVHALIQISNNFNSCPETLIIIANSVPASNLYCQNRSSYIVSYGTWKLSQGTCGTLWLGCQPITHHGAQAHTFTHLITHNLIWKRQSTYNACLWIVGGDQYVHEVNPPSMGKACKIHTNGGDIITPISGGVRGQC